MPPKTSDKLEKEVRAIAKLPGNKQCVDCGEKVRSGSAAFVVSFVERAGTERRGFVSGRTAAAAVCGPHPLHLRVHPLLRHSVSPRLLAFWVFWSRSADETHRRALCQPRVLVEDQGHQHERIHRGRGQGAQARRQRGWSLVRSPVPHQSLGVFAGCDRACVVLLSRCEFVRNATPGSLRDTTLGGSTPRTRRTRRP